MFKRVAPIAIALSLIILPPIDTKVRSAVAASDEPSANAVTAHEWGTFTTVAGVDGHAVAWLPLAGPADLPCFVDHFQNNGLSKSGVPGLDYEQARLALKGTVRMETPVVYFYAGRQTTVNVGVRFPQGLITEWYPQARVVQPRATAGTLSQNNGSTTIEWYNVAIQPGTNPAFPTESSPSHYYAARDTDAAPLNVGGKNEKFLFYRGIGSFPVPLSAKVMDSGQILLTNLRRFGSPASRPAFEIGSVILFEN